MKNTNKIFIAIIFAVCTLLFASCAGGNSSLNEESDPTDVLESYEPIATETTKAPVTLPPSKAFEIIPEGAEKWIDAKAQPSSIIMSQQEIQNMNEKIRNDCDALVDILNYAENISGEDVKNMMYSSSGPSLPKYDENGNSITESKLDQIRSNRNLGNINDVVDVRRGVTVQRAYVRALPTNMEFYNYSYKQDHDRMQETELSAGSAVIVLHESKDSNFYFIQSYYYYGWVSADCIAMAESEESIKCWEQYAKLLNMNTNSMDNMDFVVITDSLLEIDGVKLSMGTALPLDKNASGEDYYAALLPCKNSNGELAQIEAKVSIESACVGFPEYNYKNFCIQAFKYVGMPYGWGGMKDGIDCSGYVLSVFKTFGFVFPRNTGEQYGTVGNVNMTTDMTGSQISQALSKTKSPTIIYIPGHAMIYLGEIDGVHYIIHAPGGGKVCEDTYDKFSSVMSFCLVGLNGM